jgi:putative sterol carrier protein
MTQLPVTIPEAYMSHPFPSESWLMALGEALNNDARYAEVAKNWEGDLLFIVEGGKEGNASDGKAIYYLDLWHGKCRQAVDFTSAAGELPKAAFTLRSDRAQYLRILTGELDPMQAMLTRRLRVEGNMAYMLRNVPVVLDFVRCARQVPIAA